MYLANRLWHGCPIGFFTWQNLNKSYPPPFRYTEQMVYRQSAFACAGSESAVSVLRQKGYTGPTLLLPGHVDPAVHHPIPAAELRTELGIPADAVILGFMGRLSPAKGLTTLIEALSSIRALPWHLVLVGEGTFADTLRETAAQHGLMDRIHFTGYVPHTEAPRYLSLFDVLVLPSETHSNWKEQFGRVLIEALACGTPLVGSTSGEIPFVIERTGAGLTFPEGDASALGEVLRKMIGDPKIRNQFAKTGRAHVLEEYTDQVLARKFIDTLQRTCGPSSDASPRPLSLSDSAPPISTP
jgi:glycosyltransferase involved in cell wall biosynthesis